MVTDFQVRHLLLGPGPVVRSGYFGRAFPRRVYLELF